VAKTRANNQTTRGIPFQIGEAHVSALNRTMLVGFALAATLLSGCSSLKLMYSFADDLVERQVNRYVDLDRDQARLVDRSLDRYFEWHRRNMLPRYASFLREVAAEHREPASRETLERQWQKGRA